MKWPDPQTEARLVHHAILTATPDLIAGGLVRALLRRLKSNGIVPVALIPHVFSEAESFMLYGGRVTHQTGESRLHSKWLSPRMFTAGTSLVALLRQDGGDEPLQRRLMSLKGRGRLGEYREDQLRGLSRSVDRSLSLVHSPDDLEGLLHETDLLLGREVLHCALEPGLAALGEEAAAALVGEDEGGERHLFDILFQVIGRAASLCVCDPSSGSAAPARELLRESEAERRRLAAEPLTPGLADEAWRAVADRSEGLRALFRSERDRLDWELPWLDLRRRLARVRLLRLLVEGSERSRFDPRLSEAVVEALRDAQLPLGRWETHRLHVVAAFHSGGQR